MSKPLSQILDDTRKKLLGFNKNINENAIFCMYFRGEEKRWGVFIITSPNILKNTERKKKSLITLFSTNENMLLCRFLHTSFSLPSTFILLLHTYTHRQQSLCFLSIFYIFIFWKTPVYAMCVCVWGDPL